MKKLISILAVLALTAPCFASSVEITATASGNVLTIGYTNASGGVPVGVSMEVSLSGGDAYVNAATDVTEGGDGYHDVYIDWAYTNGTTSLDANGVSSSSSAHPLAQIGSAGAATLGSGTNAGFALCMGELAATPPTSGTLAVITFTGTTDTLVSLSVDTSNRGGIVDENGDAMTVTAWGSDTVTFGCSCPGDTNNDGVIDTADISAIVNLLTPLTSTRPRYTVTPTTPPGLWNDCYDYNNDDVIDTGDISGIVTLLTPLTSTRPRYTYTCP